MKNRNTIYNTLIVILFFVIITIVSIFLASCATPYVGTKYRKCPTNDKTFFYKRMGVRPTKQFLKYGR
jgi:hypothetical protein